jgi:uncharacterized protein (DUF2062 family)
MPGRPGRPRAILAALIAEATDRHRLGMAIALGIFVGTTPLYGAHAWIAIGLAVLLRWNKIAAVAGTHISVPFVAPFLVAACVQVGHLILHGTWLPLSVAEIRASGAGPLFLQWAVGCVPVGLALAATGYGLTRLAFVVRDRRARRIAVAALVAALLPLGTIDCVKRPGALLPDGATATPVTPEITKTVADLRAAEDAVRCGRALFESDLTIGGREIARAQRGVLYFAKPDRLRMRTFSPLGFPVFDVVLARGALRTLAPEGVDLAARPEARAFVDALARTVLDTGPPDRIDDAYRPAGGVLVVVTESESGREVTEIDGTGPRIVRRVAAAGTGREVAVSFSDFRAVSGIPRAHAIRVEVPRAGLVLAIRVLTYALNEPIPDDQFPE